MGSLKIRFLGNIEIYRDEQPITGLPTRKIQSLFAYLVTYRQSLHPREVLAELFWGELGADKAKNNLRYALSVLRRTLGPYLVIERHQVGFNAESRYWLDVEEFEDLITHSREQSGKERFETLRQAMELYRGDFLTGFYDEWVLEEQRRLKGLYFEVLDTLALWPRGPFGGSSDLRETEEAGLKRELARAHYSQRDPETALAFAQQALQLYKRGRDLAGQGSTYLLLGAIHRYLGQIPQARDCYQQALELSHQAQSLRTEWQVLNNLGWLEWNEQAPRKAIRYYEQALPLCRRVRDRWGEAVVLNNWGIAHLDEEEYHEALGCFNRAYEIIEQLENDELKLENLSYRALAYLGLRAMREMERCLTEALEMLEGGVGSGLFHKVYLNLWRIYQATGRPEGARAYLKQAYEDVMARAQRIKNAALRESSLWGNRTHREVLLAWRAQALDRAIGPS